MADRYFVGTGGFSDGFSSGFAVPLPPGPPAGWDNVNYWSATSGGSGGASVPGAADKAIFDGNSPECGVDVKPNIRALELTAAFTSALSLYAYGITVGTGGIAVGGGSLNMGSAACAINAGQLTTSGGTLTLTSDTLTVDSGDVIMLGGTLVHNSGVLSMARTLIGAVFAMDINGRSLYRMEVDYGSSFYMRWDSALTIINMLLIISHQQWNSSVVGAMNITLKGDLDVRSPAVPHASPSPTILVSSTGNQYIASDSAITSKGIPHLTVNKASGQLSMSGRLGFVGQNITYEWITGTVDWSGCPVLEILSYGFIATLTGGNTTINCDVLVNLGSYTFTTQLADLIITGDFTTTGTTRYLATGGGEIHLVGDDIDFQKGNNNPQNGVFVINGAGDQLVHSTLNAGRIGKLVVDKTSGLLTITDKIEINSDAAAPQLEYVQGNVDASGSTIVIGKSTMTFKTGTMVLGDVELNTVVRDITFDGNFVVGGNLVITSNNAINSINLGVLQLHGNISSIDNNVNGNCPVDLVGAGDQEISMDGFEFGNGDLRINKPSGSAKLIADFTPPSWTGSLTVYAGVLDLNGFDLTIGTVFGITDTLDLKGNETITAAVGPVWGGVSTARFHDAAVVALVDRYDSWNNYKNVVLDRDGTGKAHHTTAGATVTFEGVVSTGASHATPAIIRSTVNGVQCSWTLSVTASETLGDAVDVQDNDASGGTSFLVGGSVDSGNNINWIFGGGGGGGLIHMRPSRIMTVGQGYVSGMNPKDMLGYVTGMGGQGGVGAALGGGGAPAPGPGATYSIFVEGAVSPVGGTVITGWNPATGAFDVLHSDSGYANNGSSTPSLEMSPDQMMAPTIASYRATYPTTWPVINFQTKYLPANTVYVPGYRMWLHKLDNKFILIARNPAGGDAYVYRFSGGIYGGWSQLGVVVLVNHSPVGVYALSNGNILAAVAYSSRFLRVSADEGASWVSPGGLNTSVVSDSISENPDGSKVFMVTPTNVPTGNAVYVSKSMDNGLNWSWIYVAAPVAPLTFAAGSWGNHLLALGGGVLLFTYIESPGRTDAAIMRSTDEGASWSNVFIDNEVATTAIYALHQDKLTGNIYALIGGGGISPIGGKIIVSTDSGVTWETWYPLSLDILGPGNTSAKPRSFIFANSRR